jgi:proteasome assembly chaperone (PAC2) family protein
MSEALNLWEIPRAEEVYLFCGWRQWADAGSVSSGLPLYLIQHTAARKIGEIRSDGFYLFQIPGTHDLVRPVVKYNDGYPESLRRPQNEFYYARLGRHGLAFFLGDEPHMDVERYVEAILQAARKLNARRLISFGGMYGEFPYDKERLVSAIVSHPELRQDLPSLEVELSNYHGGASIGSYLCRKAGENHLKHIGFYAVVPSYDFSSMIKTESVIRIENDFTAWLNVMRRVNFMLKIELDLNDLEQRSTRLMEVMDNKINELDEASPQLGLRDYLRRLSDDFTERPFNPLDEVWEEEFKRLFGKLDGDES